MNLSSFVGLIAGVIFVVWSIILGGDIASYFDMPSVMIVVGGTLASIMISFSFEELKQLMPEMKTIFFKNKINLREDQDRVIDLATRARREGLLTLDGEDMGDPFLQKGLELVIDGTDQELVREVLEGEIALMEEKDSMNQKIMTSGAQYAPAFGMVGTLIGLINMLKTLSDTDSLGPSMATALITTFYGVILANVIFLPFASKLKSSSAERSNRYAMLTEGIIAIQNGENPRLIREKMEVFIPKETKKNDEKAGESNTIKQTDRQHDET
ncbi:MAG: motility protein A [Clostridiaceae bacterium]|nr:motility protein A [Clostridiaceae bacterium]